MDVLFYYAASARRADAETAETPSLNSEHDTLHSAEPSDTVWVITWEDGRYRLLQRFVVAEKQIVPDGRYGPYRLVPDFAQSRRYHLLKTPPITELLEQTSLKPKPAGSSFQGRSHVRPLSAEDAMLFRDFARDQIACELALDD